MRGWLLLVPALMLLISGCSGAGGPKAAPTLSGPGATDGVDDPSKGKVIGYVVDDEALPIEGVNVALFAAGSTTPRVAMSGTSGDFAFLGVEPGTYLLVAQKITFADTTQKNLFVEGGKTLELTVTLIPLPSNEPHKQLVPFNGMVSSYTYKLPAPFGYQRFPIACGSSCTNNFALVTTNDMPSAMQNMVGEMQWSSSQALGGDLLWQFGVNLQASTKADYRFIDVDGPSPVRVVVTADKINAVLAKNDGQCSPTGEVCQISSYVWGSTGNTHQDADFGIAFSQKYTQFVSIFYRMDAPADYTAF